MGVYESATKICTTVAELPAAAAEGTFAYCRDDDFARWWDGSAWKCVPRTIIKTADEARTSNATMTADSVLVCPVAASTQYVFEALIYFTTNATADFKLDVNHTGGTASYREASYYLHGAAEAHAYTAAIGTDIVVDAAGFGSGFVHLHGALQTTSAGTLQIRWAQNVSDASAATVLRGSFLRVVSN